MKNRITLLLSMLYIVLIFSLISPACAPSNDEVTDPVVDGSSILDAVPLDAPGGNVTPMVAAGFYHTVGLKSDGTAISAGQNYYGECNISAWTGIVQISAGSFHTVGLKSDGTVVAVGDNDYGQCDVGGCDDIVETAAGRWHTVGVRANGSVVAMGHNDYGQCDVGNWTDITQVAAGEFHTVGLKSDGTVVATGLNSYGRCDVGNWTDIVQVAAGWTHTAGLKSDGTVVALGQTSYGQCNVDDWTGIVHIAAGGQHTMGLKSDGSVIAAGYGNYYGQYDVEAWIDIVQIAVGYEHAVGLKSDGTLIAVGYHYWGQSNVGDWTGIVQVDAGAYHTTGLRSDGTLVAVGGNNYGQCDVSSWTDIVQIATNYYHTVGLRSDSTVMAVGNSYDGRCHVGTWTAIEQVAAGGSHTVGLKSDGTVVAVGDNDYGQCDVGDWTGIVQVTAGGFHTVGLKSDGTVVAVGSTGYGQCAVGNWTDIVQVSAGGFHTVGLKSDGSVVATGANGHGQCDVGDWKEIVQFAANNGHTVGLKSDSTVIAVGNNEYGQCDVSDWTDIAQVAAGCWHTAGLRLDGTVTTVSYEAQLAKWNLGDYEQDPIVTFPDPNLKEVIHEAINRPEGNIYQSDLEELTSLDARSRNITSLIGLEYAVNMTMLNLGGNKISDISQLASLTKLNDIWLWGNYIRDLGPLAQLSDLAYISAQWNLIRDICPLANLNNLKHLSLEGNLISDISPLTDNLGLAEGDTIDLRDNPLTLDSVHIRIPQLEERGVEVLDPMPLTIREAIIDYFPILYILDEERFFPTDFWFDDYDVDNNPSHYNAETWPSTAYVNTVETEWEGNDYLVVQYWFYYAHDFKLWGCGAPGSCHLVGTNDCMFCHHHDFEGILVFLKREGGEYVPEYVTFFGHYDHMTWPWNDRVIEGWRAGTHPGVFVALGTHASYPNRRPHLSARGEYEVTGYPYFVYGLPLIDVGWLYVEPVGFQQEHILEYSSFDEIYVEQSSLWPGTIGGNLVPWHNWDDTDILRELHEPTHAWYLQLHSPVDVLVTDSEGRHVGVDPLTGSIVNEIPESRYCGSDNDTKTIIIPGAVDGDYTIDLFGTATGNYNMHVDWLAAQGMIGFTATDIPTSLNALHQYTIDWDALSQGGEGVTIEIDSDGDGVFERTITSDNELTRDEFLSQPWCFIATAAYGTPMADEVQILRDFRDEYLLTNPVGQAFVDLYYNVSPPIAEFITDHSSLKPIVRAGLVPAVVLSAIIVNTSEAEKLVIIGLLVLVSVAIAVWATRRRDRLPDRS